MHHLSAAILECPRQGGLTRRKRVLYASLTLLIVRSQIFGQIYQDGTICASDGVDLEATIIYPVGSPPSGGFPGIVLVHGYGGNKDEMQPIARAIATYGYASLAYSVRGQGKSGGLSTANGDRERQDLLEVIRYFRNSPKINPNKLGVAGGSQGGIHAWMAAVYQMPGVKAVAPLFATPDYARALVPNGCVKYTLPRELTLRSVRYSHDRDIVRYFIIRDEYDSLLAHIGQHDLEHLVGTVQIPVLQGMGWGDFLFPANGGIRVVKNLSVHGIPVWSYFGANGHGEAIDPTEAAFLLDKEVHWFDHWLKGLSLAQDSLPMVFYSDNGLAWPHHISEGWPPPSSKICTLYVSSHGLSEVPPSVSESFPFDQIYDSTYTPVMGWDSLYGGARFVNAFSTTSQRFLSAPLSIGAEMTGIPTGKFLVWSNAPKFQVHVRLFDVETKDSGEVWRLVSRSTNGIRNNTAGGFHDLWIEATAFSHVVPAGHRIGVEITSLDMATDLQANTIPYFVTSHASVVSSPSIPGYVTIPLVGPNPFTGILAENVSDSGGRLRPLQTYTKPSILSTTTEYALTYPSFVGLKVYSTLGQLVARLLDGEQKAGFHEVQCGRSGLTSGVHYYHHKQ